MYKYNKAQTKKEKQRKRDCSRRIKNLKSSISKSRKRSFLNEVLMRTWMMQISFWVKISFGKSVMNSVFFYIKILNGHEFRLTLNWMQILILLFVCDRNSDAIFKYIAFRFALDHIRLPWTIKTCWEVSV